jgi:hypothetical protein
VPERPQLAALQLLLTIDQYLHTLTRHHFKCMSSTHRLEQADSLPLF